MPTPLYITPLLNFPQITHSECAIYCQDPNWYNFLPLYLWNTSFKSYQGPYVKIAKLNGSSTLVSLCSTNHLFLLHTPLHSTDTMISLSVPLPTTVPQTWVILKGYSLTLNSSLHILYQEPSSFPQCMITMSMASQ